MGESAFSRFLRASRRFDRAQPNGPSQRSVSSAAAGLSSARIDALLYEDFEARLNSDEEFSSRICSFNPNANGMGESAFSRFLRASRRYDRTQLKRTVAATDEQRRPQSHPSIRPPRRHARNRNANVRPNQLRNRVSSDCGSTAMRASPTVPGNSSSCDSDK